MTRRFQVPIVAALVAFTPAVAWSQSTANDLDPAVTTPVEQHDDEDFPWGLLGLLGLAGLFGLKRRDDNVTVDRSTSKNRM